ncbi:hypothetical protein [Agarilytica rhodophyticola]|uniref:hypothetical protein n=1 Tax=Agarilytica rhodophyticola TaxID=1737490 RepID=UPI000B349CEA|nr:hypothetical protein [Agarilytica rhodophyticola]
MPKEISTGRKEHIKLLIEEQTYSPEWQDGFLSTFKKNNYNTQEIVELFEKNKPADIDDIDTNLVQLQKEVEVVEGELKKIKGLLDKKKITNFNFSEEIAPLFDHLTLREKPYNILNLCKTNELRFNIIKLIKKDEKFAADNELEEFNYGALKKGPYEKIDFLEKKIATFKLFIKTYGQLGNANAQNSDGSGQHLPQVNEDKDNQAKNSEDKRTAFKEIQKLRNEIINLLPPIQKKVRKLITETLSEQWGTTEDETATAPKKQTRYKKVRKSDRKNKVTTKVETTHLLCKTQNVINNIYNEYYGLVDSLINKSDTQFSNIRTFGNIIFDVYLQSAEGTSSSEEDITPEALDALAKEFKESIIENKHELNKLKKEIIQKEESTTKSNAHMKGENIRPILEGLQHFLERLWVQIQSINDYYGVDFVVQETQKERNSKKGGNSKPHFDEFTQGNGPFWQIYKKKLQTLANSISTDVSSTINQLQPHWQRSAIAEVNIQARNFTDVVGSYMHILLRTPRLIIETKKAKFELVRIVNRIELGLEHEMDTSIQKTQAVFSLIKGIANTAGEAANLAAAASGVMVTGGMSHGSASGFTKTETSASGDISTTQSKTYPGSTQSYVPLGRIDMKTDGILQGVENLCTLGARQALKEIQIIIKQTHSSLENDLAILEEMQQCAQNAQKAILGKEERWLPQIDIVRFETEGDRYLDFLAGLWAANGILNDHDSSSTPGKLERENLRAKTNEYNAITKLAKENKLQLTVSQ